MKAMRRRRRGMLLMDGLATLAISLALLMAMSVTIAHQSKAERELSERRAQARRLEGALSVMQGGGAADGNVAVERLKDAAPEGMAWVRVSAADGPRMTMAGLVPAGLVGRAR